MPVLKVGDIIRFTKQLKQPQAPFDEYGCELRTAIVKSVGPMEKLAFLPYGKPEDWNYITYEPHATPDCQRTDWCRWGTLRVPVGAIKAQRYGLQTLEVIGHIAQPGE